MSERAGVPSSKHVRSTQSYAWRGNAHSLRHQLRCHAAYRLRCAAIDTNGDNSVNVVARSSAKEAALKACRRLDHSRQHAAFERLVQTLSSASASQRWRRGLPSIPALAFPERPSGKSKSLKSSVSEATAAPTAPQAASRSLPTLVSSPVALAVAAGSGGARPVRECVAPLSPR